MAERLRGRDSFTVWTARCFLCVCVCVIFYDFNKMVAQ